MGCMAANKPGTELADQWRDILAIVKVQGPALDRAYARDGARILGVTDLLERAFSEAG